MERDLKGVLECKTPTLSPFCNLNFHEQVPPFVAVVLLVAVAVAASPSASVPASAVTSSAAVGSVVILVAVAGRIACPYIARLCLNSFQFAWPLVSAADSATRERSKNIAARELSSNAKRVLCQGTGAGAGGCLGWGATRFAFHDTAYYCTLVVAHFYDSLNGFPSSPATNLSRSSLGTPGLARKWLPRGVSHDLNTQKFIRVQYLS